MQIDAFRPQQFGKYLLTERIGAGGMAEIFRATAFGVEGFTKEICIKRILPTLTCDETFVKMFIDEAKIAVSLHHANVVQVFDLGRIGEHFFIAMELVHGRDLLQIINGCRAVKRRMPVHIALYILSETCKGLDYAHRMKAEGRPLGIIHRDVSPSNILVSWEGEVKVADFGIAKAAHKEAKTVTGTMKGKYGYMSPEQVLGEPVDFRSDIFAAGILLWECLAAKRLFKGETDLETLEKVREAQVSAQPSAINKKVPLEVDRLVSKALALRPADRFQTAGEMHDALADRLFATGKRIDTKALAAFMQKLFAEDIRREEERGRERRRAQDATRPPVGPAEVTPSMPPGTAGPPTRPDLPFVVTPLPRPRRSPFFIGLIGFGIILAIATAVVLAVWLAYQPAPPGRPDPAVTIPVGHQPARPGTLSIDSSPPGARIKIDGNDTGRTTPATITGLDRSRPHRLALKLAGREPWSKGLEFGEMEMVAIQAQLVPSRPTGRPPVRRHPKPAMGTLNVNAEGAWAYVYVDGKKQSRPTPLYGLKLKPGTHTIRLENPKLGLASTRKVKIEKGKTTDLVVKLK